MKSTRRGRKALAGLGFPDILVSYIDVFLFPAFARFCFCFLFMVSGECSRENKGSKGIFLKKWMEIPFLSRNVLK